MLKLAFTLLAWLPSRPRRWLTRALVHAVWNWAAEEVVVGRERVPPDPCLFVANHLSNADAFIIQRALGERRVWFVAGTKLKSTAMTRLASEVVDTVPIRPGSPDIEAIRRSIELLRRGESVLIFPEGTRSRTASLLRGKKGVALVASRARAPIVPVALVGTERLMPIDDRDMARERIHRARVEVHFGAPFGFEEVAPGPDEEDPRQAAVDAMMRRIAAMLPERYRGVYGGTEAHPSAPPRGPGNRPSGVPLEG